MSNPPEVLDSLDAVQRIQRVVLNTLLANHAKTGKTNP